MLLLRYQCINLKVDRSSYHAALEKCTEEHRLVCQQERRLVNQQERTLKISAVKAEHKNKLVKRVDSETTKYYNLYDVSDLPNDDEIVETVVLSETNENNVEIPKTNIFKFNFMFDTDEI
jgi:hypothetical protein